MTTRATITIASLTNVADLVLRSSHRKSMPHTVAYYDPFFSAEMSGTALRLGNVRANLVANSITRF